MSSRATSSSFSKQKSKKRRFTREQLLKNLQIIGTIQAPLPPDLPPSPPASRSSSPAPSLSSVPSKRKLDFDPRIDGDAAKRPRTSEKPHKVNSSSGQNPTPPHSHKTSTHAYDLHEEGEVHEGTASAKPAHVPQLATISSGLPTPPMPVRRPRRGRVITQGFDSLHDKYHNWGRTLKYSGDARFWSTFPPSHKHYKPLLNPPAPGTPYHTHGGLMSRMELLDALLYFVYALWLKDYAQCRCAGQNWVSLGQFLSWCKAKWMQESSISVSEKAFIGLIHMVEAFIHQRKVQYAVRGHIEKDICKLVNFLPSPEDLAKAARAAGNPSRLGTGAQSTPPGMLPSPAGTLPASSANSTPTNPSNGTPTSTSNGHIPSQPPAPSAQPPTTVLPTSVPPQLNASVPQPLIWELKDVIEGQNAAGYCMGFAQKCLSLPILREHFPRTFGRMVYSTLSADDEHEPDIEDDEGELFWPGQCVTGEGLGWVCLMGRAMLNEFGKESGYKSLQGIIPKPDTSERRFGQNA